MAARMGIYEQVWLSLQCKQGVAVLFKNSFEFHINQEIIDERGNFIILDINIQDYRMTLVAIYGPNEDNPDFFFKS